MKPWLLNILACPIDKSHPLKAQFFTWETPDRNLELLAKNAGKPEEKMKRDYSLLAKQLLDGTISPPAIEEITDKSRNNATVTLLAKTRKALKKLAAAKGRSREEVAEEFSSELDVVHRYFNLTEVDKGLLVCKKCGRWYPIGRAVEGVPEMLPDDLREEEEVHFLREWKAKIPKKVLTEGKPFSIREK